MPGFAATAMYPERASNVLTEMATKDAALSPAGQDPLRGGNLINFVTTALSKPAQATSSLRTP